MLKNTMRKAAQRATPGEATCQACSKFGAVQRHHPDYSDPSRVEILCRACHWKADVRDGTRQAKQPKQCKVCGNDFLPKHSKRSATCGRECLSTLGRQNAMRRWYPATGT